MSRGVRKTLRTPPAVVVAEFSDDLVQEILVSFPKRRVNMQALVVLHPLITAARWVFTETNHKDVGRPNHGHE